MTPAGDISDEKTDEPRLQSQTLGLGEMQCAGEIRILVIDDEEMTCRLIQTALAHKDFAVDTLSDPVAVESHLVARAQPEQAYHVILLDYVLPGLDAERLFPLIHKHQPDASIIVVTGYPSVDSALNSLRARAYDYLTKPFQVTQLREIVLRCLEGKGLLRMSDQALRESLGGAIRDRRKSLGLTLQKMADKTGVSLGYLSQIELGKNSASIETLYKVCLALGIKMAELFQAVQKA